MKKTWSWLVSFLKIGSIGFGGGTSLIPVLEEEMVNNRKLITKEEFDNSVLVASITPGALPVEVSGGIGKTIAGIRGMLLAAICMALPGVLMTIALLVGMDYMPSDVIKQIELISIGITAFIFSMLTKYITGTFAWAKSKNRSKLAAVIVIGVFLLNGGKSISKIVNYFGGKMKVAWNVSTVWILLLAIAGLAAFCYLRNKREGRKQSQVPMAPQGRRLIGGFLKEELIWFLFLVICSIPALLLVPRVLDFMLSGLFSSFISFGGGDAYLTVADGLFIGNNLISESEFYGRLVTVVNVLPGSILCKTLSGVGYYMGYDAGGVVYGILTALVGFACSVVGSLAVISLVQWFFDTFEKITIFQMLKSWIKAIISGLLGSVILSLLYQCLKIAKAYGCNGILMLAFVAVLYGLNLFLEKKCGVSTWVCVLVSGLLSCGVGNIIM